MLLPLLLALAAPEKVGGSCTGAVDCGLLGVCDAGGSCSCAPGFHGDSCGFLDLLPQQGGLPAAELWPLTGAANSSAWGFTVAYDPADELYHAVADISCGCSLSSTVRDCTEYTGVLASGGYASSLIHLESSRPDGGWRVVSLLAPPTSFNPHLIHDPTDGSFALYFRVNAVDAQPICVGNSSGPTPGLQSPGASLIKRCVGSSTTNCIHAGGSESGTNIYLATAPRMTGPWKVQSVGVKGEAKLHVSNPSVTFLRPGTPASKLGKLAMAFRYNSPHGETNGVAYADGPEGPFVAVANLTCHGCEDPFIWQQPDGTMHMIYHNKASSYHAFSADGSTWTEHDDSPMFNTSMAIGGGRTLKLNRRERPELVFDPKSRAPVLLLNGASVYDSEGVYRAFSLVQHVGNNGSAGN